MTYIDIYRNYKSNLDLVLSSPDIAGLIQLSVCDNTWSSDHFLIFIQIAVEKYRYVKKTFRIRLKRTNWLSFRELLLKSLTKFYEPSYNSLNPIEKYTFFVNKHV